MPIEIKMPAVTPDFDAGTLKGWLKSVGDTVAKGDVLVEVETDKAVIEVEAQESGVLGKILVEEGTDDVPVHATIGLLLKEGESESALEGYSGGTAAAPQEPAPAPAAAAAPVATAAAPEPGNRAAATGTGGRLFASPLARRIAGQQSVPLEQLSGRGPRGRILKADVEAYLASTPAQTATATSPAAPAAQPVVEQPGQTLVPHSNMRKVIAQRLVESKQQVPHFYLSIDCRIDTLMALRAQLNAETPEGEGAFKLTVNDFVVKAVALAMRDVPAVNASWSDQGMIHYQDVDISVAVSTDEGLITPIVRRADTKGLAVISNQVKELAGRARDGRLKPAEYQGGGFCISNLGMYGIQSFGAIINPPQACILAVGAGEKKPVVDGDELAIATVVNCTLSVDHRAVDGAVGARFLQAFKRYLENPLHLMLNGGA